MSPNTGSASVDAIQPATQDVSADSLVAVLAPEKHIQPWDDGIAGQESGEEIDSGPCNAQAWTRIVDSFPAKVPIFEAELETIETYLGTVLDELLSTEQRQI